MGTAQSQAQPQTDKERFSDAEIECNHTLLLTKHLSLTSDDLELLTCLDLEDNQLDDEAGVAIAAALRDNRSITELRWANNRFDTGTARALADCVRVNHCIVQLSLAHNFLGQDGARMLAQALKVNSVLTSLDLSCASLGREGSVAVIESLTGNAALVCLRLQNNRLGPPGASAMAKLLSATSSLRSLNLYSNELTNFKRDYSGVISMNVALKYNSTLTALDLGENDLSLSASKIITGLQANSCMTQLNLGQNQLPSSVACELSTMLELNATLRSLDLSRNNLGPWPALGRALTVNSSLTHLDVSMNSLQGSEEALLQGLKANTSLVDLSVAFCGLDVTTSLALTDAAECNVMLRLFSRALKCPNSSVHKHLFDSPLFDPSLVQDIFDMVKS